VGNSNVVSLPRGLERKGYTPGTFILVDELENGDLILRKADSVRAAIAAITPQVIEQNREALDILAKYDRGEPTPLRHPEESA
jgi:hypothetical protein